MGKKFDSIGLVTMANCRVENSLSLRKQTVLWEFHWLAARHSVSHHGCSGVVTKVCQHIWIQSESPHTDALVDPPRRLLSLRRV